MSEQNLGQFLAILATSKHLDTVKFCRQSGKLVSLTCHFETFDKDKAKGRKVNKSVQHLKVAVLFSQLNNVDSIQEFAVSIIDRVNAALSLHLN